MGLAGLAWVAGPAAGLAGGDDGGPEKLLAADAAAAAARVKALGEAAPEGATLVAYLDCGTQRESTTTETVTIAWQSGKPYRFAAEAENLPPTGATIFFGETEVVFTIRGLDRGRRYQAGIAWWDYDNGGRTQQVLVGSPDGRKVRLAVPAIRLPDFEASGRGPAERRFSLPVTFAAKGCMRLAVQNVTGPNAVVSEVWICELP